jgi:hypothetical protein
MTGGGGSLTCAAAWDGLMINPVCMEWKGWLEKCQRKMSGFEIEIRITMSDATLIGVPELARRRWDYRTRDDLSVSFA